MKRCQACGVSNGDQARFCIGCGARLDGAAPAASDAPAPNPPGASVIRFECSACRQHLAADPDMAGDAIECPQCGRTLVIPGVAQPAPVAPPVQAPPEPVPVQSDAGPAEVPARRRPGIVARVALAAVLAVVLAGSAAVIVPGLLPGAVKKPPRGWIPHAHPRSDSIVFAPPDWTCPAPDQAERQLGFRFDPDEIMLLLGQNSGRNGSPLEQVVEIGFHGWRDTDGLHEKGPRRFLEDKLPTREDIEKDGAKLLLRVIHKVAGGVASETVIESKGVRNRHVVLIAPNHAGALHIVHFRCQAEADQFDRLDAEIFHPMLDSFLYCADAKRARAAYRAAGVLIPGDVR